MMAQRVRRVPPREDVTIDVAEASTALAASSAASQGVLRPAHQDIREDEIEAVRRVLRSERITQGPMIQEFEERFAAYCGASYGVAFSSGTAALHAACAAAGIGPGDEAITTPLTFVATANAVIYQGGVPVFADIDAQTLTVDPQEISRRITKKTKAIIPMHFAGLPCEMGEISDIARRKGLTVIEDACHALGAQWRSPQGRWERIGSCSHSDMAVFSFHPVKQITTGEGGMVLTNRKDLGEKLRAFRHHGIARPEETATAPGEPWDYQMRSLGYNYRITDFQCALGLKQLERLEEMLSRRREIARAYGDAFRELRLTAQEGDDGLMRRHAWHLFVIQLPPDRFGADRATVFRALREAGLGVNIHYLPVHLHPFYRERWPYQLGDYPVAEQYYEGAVTLPLFPRMSEHDVEHVVRTVQEVWQRYSL